MMAPEVGSTGPWSGAKARPVPDQVDWIDFAKACAMFLVVLGHCALIPRSDRALIYTFHVPAFLFLTGLLLRPGLGDMPYGTFLRHKILPLLRLYGFFSACAVGIFAAGLIWDGAGWTGPVTAAIGASVRAILTGVHGPQNAFGHMNAPLWYFPFLIVSLCAVRVAASLISRTGLPFAVGGLLLIGAAAVGLRTAATIYPWYLNFAGIGGLFIWAGWAVARYLPALTARIPYKTMAALLALGLALGLMKLLPEWRPRPNINDGEFGENGLLYFTAAFAGIAALCLLGQLVPPTAIVRLVSRHTTVIFCVHIYLLRMAENLLGYGHKSLALSILLAVVVTALSLAVSILIMPWLRRYVIRS